MTASVVQAVGWCSWHQASAVGVRVIQIDEQGSGSGGVRYACGPCRKEHQLVPLADREPAPAPVEDHAAGGRQVRMAGMFPTMSDAQREGRACPWCNTAVTAETSVDLGERDLPRFNAVIHPRACRPCTSREARASFAHHCRMCGACARDEVCADKMSLYRLAKETRR